MGLREKIKIADQDVNQDVKKIMEWNRESSGENKKD